MLHGNKVNLIAEISGNHGGSIETAKRLIKEAHICGADFVKLQAYTPDTITLNAKTDDFMVEWRGKRVSLYELYKSAHTPFDWFPELFAFARAENIQLFASVFDPSSVDMLENLGCPMYKIASFEITDLPLIEYTASTGKPIIISTGMASLHEIRNAISACIRAHNFQFSLLHCNSAYPAKPLSAVLKCIPELYRIFTCPIGLSDHTTTNTTAIAAVALGATIVEKHVTLDPQGDGPDDHFSITPEELMELGQQLDDAYLATKSPPLFGLRPSESHSLQMRRSLYFTEDIAAGEPIKPEQVRSVRPSYGIDPINYERVISMTAAKDIKANTPVRWEALK